MKNGYVCFHFIKLDAQKNIMVNTKKTFVMTPKNIDVMLGLELERRYVKEYDEEGESYESEEEGSEEEDEPRIYEIKDEDD